MIYYIQANPKVEKFRKEGIDKELEGKLDRMFMNITTIGYKAWTTSSRVIPLDDYEDSNNDIIFPVEEIMILTRICKFNILTN